MDKSPEQIEKEKLQKRLLAKLCKASAEYGLIADGDHLLVGLSGGKDSLALVELLALRSRIFHPRFQITAAYVQVDNIGYKSSSDYLQLFCQERGVPFMLVHTAYDERDLRDGNSQENSGGHQAHIQKNHCFLCSWYRRKALFRAAEELGCNKIALGHHKDDIVETLLMNLIYQGHFGSIPPLLCMDKFPMQIVRPLCLIDEKDLQRYSELSDYKKQDRQCPFEQESNRSGVKLLLKELQRFNPNVRESLWGAMENIKADYLPKKIKDNDHE